MTQSPRAESFNFGNLDRYSHETGSSESVDTQERNNHSSTIPKIGEPFKPWRRFNFLPVPEAMARMKDMPAGAKLVYGRLCRYAGKDGACWPAVSSLAEEVGLGVRQTQKHLRSLEKRKFIRTEKRFQKEKQTSNSYDFLWHQIFEEWEKQHPKEG